MFSKFTIGALSALACLNLAQATEYNLIDLGTLGGNTSLAIDINNLGHVTGYSHVSEDPFVLHAYIYKNGTMIDIGAERDNRSSAFAINDNDQIAVFSGVNPNSTSYLYENGAWTHLGAGNESVPQGINSNGDIVGWTRSPQHAFIYSSGVVTDIGFLADDRSAALDINDNGQVVGVTGTFISGQRGFMYESGVMTDLGIGSRANALNNAGQIVGELNQRAAIYENGAWSLLDGLTQYLSHAEDINENGQIVGGTEVSGDNSVRFAFLYDAGGITILESLEGNYSWATSINNAGQIAGISTTATGERRAVMWQPVSSNTDVTIDINPDGDDPNSINPRSQGVLPVAILGSVDFDATQVDYSTVTFGLAGATPAHDGHVRDVNHDGYPDMVFHFKTQETGIICGDTEATLTGEIFDGTPITGTDTVNTVGCN